MCGKAGYMPTARSCFPPVLGFTCWKALAYAGAFIRQAVVSCVHFSNAYVIPNTLMELLTTPIVINSYWIVLMVQDWISFYGTWFREQWQCSHPCFLKIYVIQC